MRPGYDTQERVADALEKLVEKRDLHDSLLCTRCKNRCASCDKPLPVLPDLPGMWEKAFLRLMTVDRSALGRVEGLKADAHNMDRLIAEFEAIAIEQGYEKCTHGLWVDQEFLKSNPHRKVNSDA